MIAAASIAGNDAPGLIERILNGFGYVKQSRLRPAPIPPTQAPNIRKAVTAAIDEWSAERGMDLSDDAHDQLTQVFVEHFSKKTT